MASEIRVDTSKNTSGLCTVAYTNTGAVVSGIVTANSFSGDITGNITGGATGDFSIVDKIIHTGDTNTALRFPTTDVIAFETAGSERLRITSAGLVGIGTENPVGNLEVRDTKANLIVAKDGLTVKGNSDLATQYDMIQLGAGGALASYSTATATADTQLVHNAYRHSGGDWKRRYQDTAMHFRMNSPGNAFRFFNAPTGNADTNITWTERARIDANGKLQLGSTTATGYNDFDGIGSLNLSNNSADGTVDYTQGIVFCSNASNEGTWTHAGIVATGSSGYNGNLIFATDGSGARDNAASNLTERLRITSAGKIGIGCNPDYTLDVRAASGDVWVSARGGTNQGFQVRKSDNTLRGYAGNGAGVNLGAEDFAISAPAGNLSLCTGGTAASNERLRITSGGDILIGTTTLAAQNLIDGSTAITPNLQLDGTGSSANTSGVINLSRKTGSGGSLIYSSGDDGGLCLRNTDGNGITLINTTTKAVRITPTGDVGIANNSPNCRLAITDVAEHTAYASVTPSVGDCMVQLYNNPPNETANDHATIQFGVNGGSHNRVNTISAVAESAGNRKLAFTFCTDEAGSRTEKLRISGDGYVTKPAHPTFCARFTSGNGFSGDILVLTKVDDNYLTWNNGGHYSTSTGKFTAPVAGFYYFEGQVMATGFSNGTNIQDMVQIRSNQGLVSHPRQRRTYFRTEDDANGYYTNSASGQVKLAANDTVWFQRNGGGSWSYSNTNYTYFTGWLIG